MPKLYLGTLQHADDILCGADTDDIGFLIVGDPFGYVLASIQCLQTTQLMHP